MLEDILKTIIQGKELEKANKILIINSLKEYIQYLFLSLIYNQKKFKKMVFNGGSCLRIVYNLPRLSEDLDFDYDQKQLGKNLVNELELFISKEVKKKYYPKLETKIQSNIRLYLKFPILYNLGLAARPESNKLYVNIETSQGLNPYAKFTLTPISKFGYNFILYHYDLPTLMTGKINALLYRIWYKGKDKEIDIKGRDFYDLHWFFQNNVEPNWKMLDKTTGINSKLQLKKALINRIKKIVTPQKIAYDLSNFIIEPNFVTDFSKNYLEIIKKYL